MYNIIKKWNIIKQKSPEWYEERNKVITATDVSSILEINPYHSKYEVLQNKIKTKEEIKIVLDTSDNVAITWGEKHEPLAKEYYENMPLINGNRKIHEVGLIYHSKYNWLAASPDGVVENIENNIPIEKKWWLLEIKCPYKREFKNKGYKIPDYIWIQVQIQLEVCDLQFCHLLQCKYVLDENNISKLDHRKITTILRDKEWFNNIALPKLIEFWDIVLKSKQYNTFVNPYPNPKEWVSINSFNGFLLKDPIIDWLNMYSTTNIINNILNKNLIIDNNYKNKIKDKKNTFKSLVDKIIKYSEDNNYTIINLFKNDEESDNILSVNKYNITQKALIDKIDIIIKPFFIDYKRKIYGCPDILMKNNVVFNYLKLYPNTIGLEKFSYSDKNNYTLFSVTIKKNYPKNGLLSKWDNLLKNKYTFYSSILNTITNNSKTLISLIGINTCILISPETIDNECLKINEGIQWIHTLREKGNDWLKYIDSYDIPTERNIMPNMCNKFDQKWRSVKKELAEKWGELTLLWYCGINQRNRAHDKGIYTWKNINSNISSEKIVMSLYANNKDNIKSFSNRKRIINSMICLNRLNDKVFNCRNFGEITEPYDNHNALEVYIDFEFLPKSIDKKDIIYLIGMKWVCKETNTLKFESFITESLNLVSEKEMIKKWWNTVKKLKKQTKSEKVILYHWSPAEERFLNNAFKRHPLSYIKNNLKSPYYELRDLMEMYVEAEVVIRNVWGYSIKEVAKGLYKHGLISEVWDDTEKGGDNINSGEKTLFIANKCYKEVENGLNINNNPSFIPLKEYNEMDCNALYYLLIFLRDYIYIKDPRQKRKNDRSLKRERNTGLKNNNKKKKVKIN